MYDRYVVFVWCLFLGVGEWVSGEKNIVHFEKKYAIYRRPLIAAHCGDGPFLLRIVGTAPYRCALWGMCDIYKRHLIAVHCGIF